MKTTNIHNSNYFILLEENSVQNYLSCFSPSLASASKVAGSHTASSESTFLLI